MSKLILFVGPPGSGKSTVARDLAKESGFTYINQDSQGKEHLVRFNESIIAGNNIIVDRMNFNRHQRSRYLDVAKAHGYETEIRIFHQPYRVCLDRMLKRKDHETIKTEESARNALKVFFTKYERPEEGEADTIVRLFPTGEKMPVIITDLDGTLCDIEHRRHHVRGESKKNWKAFFQGIKDDKVNRPVKDILQKFCTDTTIFACTGRTEEYRKSTEDWLTREGFWNLCRGNLLMRPDGDYRSDEIIKEILLDFEILTGFNPYFILDDRDSVVKMWRRRGYTCLQVAPGDF